MGGKFKKALIALVALFGVSGAGQMTSHAVAAETISCLNGLTCLDQGWSDQQRNWWYRTSQGSRLVPLSWMLALETANGTDKFSSDANMARLGYLPEPASPANPYGLPVGFVVDEDRTGEADLMCDTFPAMCENGTMRRQWVGMNCSACHTNDIEIGERKVRVEGAPTLADFQGLEEDLLASLKATVADPSKFDRFAIAVLGGANDVVAQADLKLELNEQIVWQQKLHDKNDAPVRYGHGRLDAQGHILNKVALIAGVTDQISTLKADAPASYPFIWNTSQQTKIQWNGIATNKARIPFFGLETDIGALIRNTTEVVGVFAHLDVKGDKAWTGYRTSARLKELIGLERQLATLQSPQWPENLLGPIDQDKKARGEALFDSMCASCHSELAPQDVTTHMNEKMDPIRRQKTDIALACNTYYHKSKSGDFEGQKIFAFAGARIKPEEPTRNILINTTVGTIIGKRNELFEGMFTDVQAVPPVVASAPVPGQVDYLPGVSDPVKKKMAKDCLNVPMGDPSQDILAYKSRSLNGIWATAPYLHNGSVPSLYDLLSTSDLKLQSNGKIRSTTGIPEPEAGEPRRPDLFGVGTRRYDPVKVGFVSDPGASGNTFTFRVKDAVSGEPIPGNYNSGHDYGTSRLPEQDRLDLVEYLKSL
jgi:hypothetical protein